MTANRLDRNVVVLGGMGVGKSTAIQRFLSNEFSDTHYPTVSGTYNKKIVINDKEYNLTITDTAGQDETSILDPTFAGSTDVYVIAFSVAYRKSYDIAQVIRDKILDISGVESVAMVLVGNKSDLKEERQVSNSEAKELALKYKCPYIETSAKENSNIEEMFVKSVKIANKARGDEEEDGAGADGDKSMCIVM
ncbi:GTP-binding protein [Kickxella alabastrina]|uniref:GTP-binding protein n=1 Tax=Kickxella alabastrina TaxID=61397 RepID=A0ACC1IPA7_9FUNG|nr:GTP-binding protein [Kickxella alabastrina]